MENGNQLDLLDYTAMFDGAAASITENSLDGYHPSITGMSSLHIIIGLLCSVCAILTKNILSQQIKDHNAVYHISFNIIEVFCDMFYQSPSNQQNTSVDLRRWPTIKSTFLRNCW